LKGRTNHEEDHPELLVRGNNHGRSLRGNGFRPAVAKETQSAADLHWYMQRNQALQRPLHLPDIHRNLRRVRKGPGAGKTAEKIDGTRNCHLTANFASECGPKEIW
jgi:hypothetical protein